MKLIIGLGNPGERYQNTRHNLGFVIVDKFLKDLSSVKNTVWERQEKFKSDIAEILWQSLSSLPQRATASLDKTSLERVILVKPKTFMNNSGMAIKILADFYKISADNIWIVHDDIDLPLGSMKIRFGGSGAGHKGVGSIITSLGTDKFWRFRMGIGTQGGRKKSGVVVGEDAYEKRIIKNQKLRMADDYVLGRFTGHEKGRVKELVKRGVKALSVGLENGLPAAMNRFNTK